MLKPVVNAVEALAVLAAAVFVVMLFANEPGGGGGASPPGAELFSSNCARCHGTDGGGGIGPQLSGGAVVGAFPDAADEIEVVTDGRGGMPSFEGDLSPEEIRQVVDYTRIL